MKRNGIGIVGGSTGRTAVVEGNPVLGVLAAVGVVFLGVLGFIRWIRHPESNAKTDIKHRKKEKTNG